MSDEFDRAQPNRDHDSSAQRKRAEFQEAPGEAEADAVRDAFLKGSGQDPASVASALNRADAATRARVLSRLQRQQGNAYVQRVVSESHGAPGRMVGLSQPEMVDEVLQRKGTGDPLPAGTREEMEDHFGADLGGVRLHADGKAAALSRELDADAFTVGSDVFFAEGKANLSSTEGQALLAHEITHVGQQTGFGGPAVQRQEEGEEEPGGVTETESRKKEEEEGAV